MKRIRRRQAKTAPRPSFMIPSRNANTRKLHAQPLTPSHKDPCPSSSTTIPLLMWLKASHVRLSNAELNKQLRAWTGVEPDMGFASWQRGLQDRTIATAGWSTTPACGGRPGRSRAVFRARFRARPEEGLPQRGRLRHRGVKQAQAGPALPETVSSDDLTLSPDLTRPPRNC